jgi:hypothetical protein
MSQGDLTFNRRAVRPVKCLKDAWPFIRDDFWQFFGITIIGMLLAQLGPFGLLAGPMQCGIYLCLFYRESGRPVSFELLFKGFNYFAQSFIAFLIMIVPTLALVMVFYALFIPIMIALAALASQGGQQNETMIAVIGISLYVVLFAGLMAAAILLGALFMFTFPLIVDRGLSGWEAVKLSARAVWANLRGVVGLMLLNGLMSLLGLLACYVGAFLVLPIHFAAIMIAYRQVFPRDGSVLQGAPPPGFTGFPAPDHGQEASSSGVQAIPEGPAGITTPASPPPEPPPPV